MMFDLGIIPKRLRSASDRSKFYKLIEASLYGGISSAITRSLRDYIIAGKPWCAQSLPRYGKCVT